MRNLDYDFFMALRLVFDTAALVLIWLVQLVIYPSFRHFSKERFRRWHVTYTQRITYVVLPVMLGQLALYGWLLMTDGGWNTWINLFLVLAVWAITFLHAVPLHDSLETDEDHLPASTRLVAVNWWRTGLWTLAWAITLVTYLADY